MVILWQGAPEVYRQNKSKYNTLLTLCTNIIIPSWGNILKYKPGLVLPRGLWCCNYHHYSQWLVYGAVTGFRSEVNKHSAEDVRTQNIQLGVYTMTAYMFTPPISGVQETIWCRQKLWRFGFCQALKHSGRLIKSVPQAAAPIGSHTDKCSPSLSYITRKTERTLWSSPILFLFSSFGSLLVPDCWELLKRRNDSVQHPHPHNHVLLPGASWGWHNLLLL